MQIEFTDDELKELEMLIHMRIVDTNRFAKHIPPSDFNKEIFRLSDLGKKVAKLREERRD